MPPKAAVMRTFLVGQRRPEEDLGTVPDCSPVGGKAHSRAVTVPSQSNAGAKLFSWLSAQSHCPRFPMRQDDFGRDVLVDRSSRATHFLGSVSRNATDRAVCLALLIDPGAFRANRGIHWCRIHWCQI